MLETIEMLLWDHITVLHILQLQYGKTYHNSYIADVKVKYPNSIFFLGGDFNCPGIDWQSGTLTDLYLPCCFREKLISLSQEAQLEQIVFFPLRGPNMLDLCFTSHPSIVSECYSVPGLSDHDSVIIKFITSLFIKQHSRKVFLYKLADWEEIRAKLLINYYR